MDTNTNRTGSPHVDRDVTMETRSPHIPVHRDHAAENQNHLVGPRVQPRCHQRDHHLHRPEGRDSLSNVTISHLISKLNHL